MTIHLVRECGDVQPRPMPPPGERCSACGRRLVTWAVVGGRYVCAHCSGSLAPLQGRRPR